MKKILSLILALATLLSVGSMCIYAQDSSLVLQDIDYTETVGTVAQSDSGTVPAIAINTLEQDENTPSRSDSGFVRYTVNLDAWSEEAGGEDSEIAEWFLNYLDGTLAALTENGGTCILNFTYSKNEDSVQILFPSTEDLVFTHIKQLAGVIGKYPDTVKAIECNMIGTSGAYGDTVHAAKRAKEAVTWLENTPNDVAVCVASINDYLTCRKDYNKYAEDVIYALDMVGYPNDLDAVIGRVGMYNDMLMYDINDGGRLNPRSEAVEQLSRSAMYGGALSPRDPDSSVVIPAQALKELYTTGYYYNYLEKDEYKSFETWSESTFDNELTGALNEMGFTADLSAYEGRTVAEFITDHIGYRYVLASSQMRGAVAKGGVLMIQAVIDNTGFAPTRGDKTATVILTNGTDTYTLPTDIDFSDINGGAREQISLGIKLSSAIAAGEYSVYMKIETEAGTGNIRFANADEGIYNEELSANYLGTFTVTEDTTPGSDEETKQVNLDFDDITDHWAKDNIESICALGYMNGISKTEFAPESITTRGQFVTVLYNMQGKPDVADVSTPFTDVDEGRYYTAPIAWAYANDIVNGTSETTFSPNDELTREQFATMLYRYAQYCGEDVSERADLSKYTDANEISNYAKETMSWANAMGIITGMTETTLAPGASATRAQMATILMRYIEA